MGTENTPRFHDGPFLLCAMLCERVLQEQDGVKSAIRIIDRVTHIVSGREAPQEMEPFDYDLHLLVRFKAGTARGPMPLQVRIEKPSGESTPAPQLTLNFEGDSDRGVDVVAPIKIKIDLAGLYWVDIILDNVRVTRVPLRVIYNPITLPQRQGGAGLE